MTSFSKRIRPYVDAELAAASDAERTGNSSAAFAHLERAHVLGQASTLHHVRVHWRMLIWGCRRRSVRECLGQVLRLAGAATKTAIGLVPAGNTGGSNVHPFKRMSIPPDLRLLIEEARSPQP
ncbi:DUF3703 domain-containing protein [Coralloluteibacterium thermophilus]|uniref:DUF3703 domain-containing protein n=1 Tax=Coralloluteibacterium thermophilum TaxID=2707049 RepID=A0ABV9NQX5_9GAMM